MLNRPKIGFQSIHPRPFCGFGVGRERKVARVIHAVSGDANPNLMHVLDTSCPPTHAGSCPHSCESPHGKQGNNRHCDQQFHERKPRFNTRCANAPRGSAEFIDYIFSTHNGRNEYADVIYLQAQLQSNCIFCATYLRNFNDQLFNLPIPPCACDNDHRFCRSDGPVAHL